MTKNEARQKIESLIKKYEEIFNSGNIRRYSEEETKKGFILPLFEALGWDTSEKNEVSAEENIKLSGRVDYGFYLNGRPKFYLEAKKFNVDLHNVEFAKQAIRYSWNKGVTWAVLSNFEHLLVFNAQNIEKSWAGRIFLNFSYTQYLENFEQLWLLSKEAFEKDLLDKEAEKYGKKLQKISITSLLHKDLDECRKILTDGLSADNKNVKKDLLDEGVQRLLDRLIFIRVAEDREIEEQTLKPLLRQWQTSKNAEPLFKSMVDKFRELDGIYDSNLFTKHPFEGWEDNSGATEKVTKKLYGKEQAYEYDFKILPADVLGTVYENYLGYKLSQSKKGVALDKDAKKRKEQGIYYTPDFIVDYIVRNALRPVLDKCASINDLKKIKVLDPACGSGSFLIKAMEVINDKYKEFGNRDNRFTKLTILVENIYGVDLDEQAVEIARLNLLINALDARMKLPMLDKNIKNGNSLISGTDKELEKYFGKNYRDKKPFNWQEEFPEVFKQGGFDCVIGNPPWGANIDKDAEYLAAKYPESTKAHKDTYKIFIDLALQKLKISGRLGFVSPNTFLYQPRYQDIKDLLDKFNYTVLNLGENIFGNVQLPCCALVAEKEKGDKHIVVDLTKIAREELPSAVLNTNPESAARASAANIAIIKNTGLTFDEVFLMKDAGINYQAVKIGKAEKGKSELGKLLFYECKKENENDVEYWKGSNIERYYIQDKTDKFVKTDYKKFKKDNERVILNSDFFDLTPKILWRQTASSLIATVDKKGVWFGRSIIGAIINQDFKNKVNIYFALSIFNSKYIDFIYRQKVLETGKVFPQVKLKYLRDLPFVIGTKSQQKKITELAKKMLALNKEFRETTENSDQWHKIKDEIVKTDKKIDNEVYKLYGLTVKEIRIVEECNK